MIGNDVVDLASVCERPRHGRFDERVMVASEREALMRSDSPERLRWMLWAAKEAAYKAARQCDRRVVFSPRRFVVRLAPDGHGSVQHGDWRFPVRIDADDSRVHAVARVEDLPDRDVAARVRALPSKPDAQGQSRRARELAIELLACWLGRAPDSLAIVREGRVPTVWIEGAASQVKLSLSHHGCFVAAACARAMGGAAA